MPPVLDVAIGTIFVFLLFSLVLSALNEVVLSFFDQRAKFLQMGLKELLGNDQRVSLLFPFDFFPNVLIFRERKR